MVSKLKSGLFGHSYLDVNEEKISFLIKFYHFILNDKVVANKTTKTFSNLFAYTQNID